MVRWAMVSSNGAAAAAGLLGMANRQANRQALRASAASAARAVDGGGGGVVKEIIRDVALHGAGSMANFA